MKVLVLGGTGAMGAHLVELLKETDKEIFVTSRNSMKSEKNVKYLQGNARDFNFIQKLLSNRWDVIIDFMFYSTEIFEKRVELFLNATFHYVFLSSARVYAELNEPINESSPRLLDVCNDINYLSTDEYAITKARQEDILKKSGKTNWTIIRPYITYSEIKFQLGVFEKEDWLYRALMGRTIILSDEINSKLTTLTYGFDVAKGIFSILGNNSAFGKSFNVTSSESESWNEILNIYLNVLENFLGVRPRYKLLGFSKFLIHHHDKNQIIYDRIYDRRFSNISIQNYVEVNGFKPVAVGLETCLQEFLKKPKFNSINWRKEAFKDRESKERASLNEIKKFRDKIKYLLFRYILK